MTARSRRGVATLIAVGAVWLAPGVSSALADGPPAPAGALDARSYTAQAIAVLENGGSNARAQSLIENAIDEGDDIDIAALTRADGDLDRDERDAARRDLEAAFSSDDRHIGGVEPGLSTRTYWLLVLVGAFMLMVGAWRGTRRSRLLAAGAEESAS